MTSDELTALACSWTMAGFDVPRIIVDESTGQVKTHIVMNTMGGNPTSQEEGEHGKE